jgi:SAM-dependent methyltransferase
MVARTHVAEPFELGGLERRRYWEEVLQTAKAVRESTGATKINYEIHGNTIPHLHTHLYPRYPGDPFSGQPIDGRVTLFERSAEQIDRLAEAVRLAQPLHSGLAREDLEAVGVYDQMADWVDGQLASSFYNAYYDRPAVLGLAGDVRSLGVLDLGCGAGHYLEELRLRGAEVVGVDGSAELLQRARARLGNDVQLVHHDLNRPLSMLADESFDGVVNALVYHHVDNRSGMLAEIRRVLKPGGWLVLSTSHPVSDWFQAGGSYFSVERVTAVFDVLGGRYEMPFWRMPLSTLLDEILEAGFELERLVEPVPTPEAREVNPRRYERLHREPAFIAVRARRSS